MSPTETGPTMMMARHARRELLRQLERDNEKYPADRLIGIERARWPEENGGPERIAVYRSRHFLVQLFREDMEVVRMSVNRCELDEKTMRWSDAISWDELQRLKSMAGFANREAIEIFPPDDDIVNVANMRHLWVLPQGHRMPFSWKRKP